MNNSITLLNDIPYGNHERHTLDLYIPENATNASGVILFIHGGGWHSGDKTAHSEDARHFCNIGYISATMNYRYVSDGISVFDELDDISSALTAIRNKCVGYGFDIKNVILSGASAGAHLALMYAYTRKNQAPVAPAAVCAYCSPVNFARSDFLKGISDEFDDWKYALLSKCCGCKITKSDFMNATQQKALERISPEKYVTADCVPTAVFHGKYDELIPIEHTYVFLQLLEENGIEKDFLLFKSSGHVMDNDPETALLAKEIIKNYAEKYFK